MSVYYNHFIPKDCVRHSPHHLTFSKRNLDTSSSPQTHFLLVQDYSFGLPGLKERICIIHIVVLLLLQFIENNRGSFVSLVGNH